MINRSKLPGILLSILLTAGVADADTVRKLSLEQLAHQADVIVHGQVVETTTAQSAERKFSFTRVSIDVRTQFKGDKLPSLTVELPGGSTGDIVQGRPGTPEFAPREEVIVFLKRRKKSEAYRLVGGNQGKFAVLSDSSGNSKQVEDLTRRKENYESFVARLKAISPSR